MTEYYKDTAANAIRALRTRYDDAMDAIEEKMNEYQGTHAKGGYVR